MEENVKNYEEVKEIASKHLGKEELLGYIHTINEQFFKAQK